jgi:hypothetical protein
MKIRRSEAAPSIPLPCFELVPEGGASAVAAFRVELEDSIVSFARDDLRRWTLRHEEPQRLLIHIGHNLVVSVIGTGLAPLHDALDRDRLMTIRRSGQPVEQGPSIKSIDLVERPEAASKS